MKKNYFIKKIIVRNNLPALTKELIIEQNYLWAKFKVI